MKGTINKTRQPPEWEKIFANAISDKVLIFKVYQEFTLNTKKQISQKWAEDFIRYIDGQQIHEKMPNITNH